MTDPTDSLEAGGIRKGFRLPPESAVCDLWSHLRLWSVAVAGLALDLWSKDWAFSKLDPGPDGGIEVLPHIMTFQRSLNTGALFGLGKGWTPVFIAASLLALGFVLFLFVQSSRHRWSLHLGLALVLAGAVGNLYDRAFAIADVVRYTKDGRTHTIEGMLIREQTNDEVVTIGSWPDKLHPQRIPRAWNLQLWQQGVVRDFVRMEPRIRIWGRSINIWPWVFNVADVLLVGGVGLLMLNFWWERRAEQAARRRVAPSPASSP